MLATAVEIRRIEGVHIGVGKFSFHRYAMKGFWRLGFGAL